VEDGDVYDFKRSLIYGDRQVRPGETTAITVSPRWNNNQNLIPSQLNKNQKDLTPMK